jgi:hypothetical protein
MQSVWTLNTIAKVIYLGHATRARKSPKALSLDDISTQKLSVLITVCTGKHGDQ